MRRTLAWLLLSAVAAGCARPRPAPSQDLPTGDGIWFEDGLDSSAGDVEETLLRSGLTTVFLPAARVVQENGRWQVRQFPPPPHPFSRGRVLLVLGGSPDADEMLARQETVGPLIEAARRAIQDRLKDARLYGRVAGIHLDLPFSGKSAEGYASLVSRIREELSKGMVLSVSLRFSPSPEDRDKMQSLISACDGFVAFVFGEGNSCDPRSADALEKPWWAGYATSARGAWQDANGEPRRTLPEWVLSRLSDDWRVEFLPGVSLKEESGQVYELRLRNAIPLSAEFSFARGDRLSFRQPLVSDLIGHLGADLTGRRFARGRIIALPGRSESERLFTLAALDDVLLGKPSKPDLHVAAEAERGTVTVSAENLSPHASILSRTSNWVEVKIPTGGILDVQPGGFSRFELYDRNHQPVTMALATIVRFYEILIQPHGRIEPARILLRRSPPKACCETRFHFVAASGQELLSDAPPPAVAPQ